MERDLNQIAALWKGNASHSFEELSATASQESAISATASPKFVTPAPILISRLSFSHIIPLFKEINQLAIQNDKLSRQRDLLLPRLMSGKLEVNI